MPLEKECIGSYWLKLPLDTCSSNKGHTELCKAYYALQNNVSIKLGELTRDNISHWAP